MIKIKEFINQTKSKADSVKRFAISNLNKIKIGSAVFIVLVVFILSEGFAITSLVQGQHKIVFVKSSDNNKSLIDIINDKNKSSSSVTSEIAPTLTSAPTLAPSPTPVPSNPRIDSISPSSGPSGQDIAIKGSLFGGEMGTVRMCLSGNCNYNPVVDSWSNTEIKARVSGMITQAGAYDVSVVTKNNITSNWVSFTVTAGQPIINNISPSNISPALNITLSGSNFGSRGQVNFYKNYPALSGTGNIESWSSTQIVVTIPGSLDGNTEYGIEVVSGEGSKSSFKYYTVGAKLTMTDYEYPAVESLSVNVSALYLSTGLVCVPSPSTRVAAGIWDFGDGETHTFQIIDSGYSSSPGKKESINTGHSYASPGTYTVVGRCKDDTGKLGTSESKTVTASN